MYIFLTLISNKSNWPKFFYIVIQVWLLCKTCESVLHRTNTGSVLLTSPYKPGANLYKELICFQQVTEKQKSSKIWIHKRKRAWRKCSWSDTQRKLYRCGHSYMYQQRKWITRPRSLILVSIHLLFSPSSQIKTVGRNCETKVVDFLCGMYILYQDIKLGPSI